MPPETRLTSKIHNLPIELLLYISTFLSVREKAIVSLVCKKWSVILNESAVIEVSPTPAFLRTKLSNIDVKFTQLQQLKLCCFERSGPAMENLVKIAQSFNGHPLVSRIYSPTSAILSGATNCKRLRHLVIREDMIAPIPHILSDSYENELDCPLLWAINRFIQWSNTRDGYNDWLQEDFDLESETEREVLEDEEGTKLEPFDFVMLPNLQHLSLRSFNNDSLADFFKGFVCRATLPELDSLELGADGAMFGKNYFKWINRAFPKLKSLHLYNIKIDGQLLTELFIHGKFIERFEINCCEVTLNQIKLLPNNLAKALIVLFTTNMANLIDLKIVHCKFKNAQGYGDTYETPIAANLVPCNIDYENPTQYPLQYLTLLGLGKHFVNADFIADYVNLVHLRLDDVGQNKAESPNSITFTEYVRSCLPNLKFLDLRFTRIQTIPDFEIETSEPALYTLSRSPSGNLNPTLVRLSLYAPSCLQKVLETLSNEQFIQSLKLGYIQSAETELQCQNLNLPHLKHLDIHTHGITSPQVALNLLTTLTTKANARNLVDIRVQATKPISFSIKGQTNDILSPVMLTPEFMTEFTNHAPRISSFRVSGIQIPPHVLSCMIGWQDTLTSAELCISGTLYPDDLYKKPMREFLLTHRLLENLEITIAKCGFEYMKQEAYQKSNDEIHQTDALMKKVCQEYRDHWLK